MSSNLQPPRMISLHRGRVKIAKISVRDDGMLEYRATCAMCGSTFLWTMHINYNTLRINDHVQLDITFVSHDEPTVDTTNGGGGYNLWNLPASDVILNGAHPSHDHEARMWKLPLNGPHMAMLCGDDDGGKQQTVCTSPDLAHTNVALFLIDVRLTRVAIVE